MATSTTPATVTTTVSRQEKQWNAIVDFVNDLTAVFPKCSPIAIWATLLQKHREGGVKQTQCRIFQAFLQSNKDALLQKDVSKFSKKRLEWKPNIYLDFEMIFTQGDQETQEAVWKHLLTLYILFHPNENTTIAKDLLKQGQSIMSADMKKSNEGEFMSKTFEKVVKLVNPEQMESPNVLLGSLFASGGIGELMSDMSQGISSGQIKPKKFIQMAKSMLDNITQQMENDEEDDDKLSIEYDEKK